MAQITIDSTSKKTRKPRVSSKTLADSPKSAGATKRHELPSIRALSSAEEAHRFFVAKLDSKHRMIVPHPKAEYYDVADLGDGMLLLKPHQETRIEDIPPAVLAMMDRAMEAFEAGHVAGPIELD